MGKGNRDRMGIEMGTGMSTAFEVEFNPVKSSGECQSWTLLDEPEKGNSTLAAMLSPHGWAPPGQSGSPACA